MAERKGMDISTWNGAVDWKKVKAAGIKFVIIRAGFGNSETQQDNRFAAYMDGALNVGLPVGVYWFSYARSVEEAKKEAEACLSVIGPYKTRITYPVFFDFEYDSETYAEKAGVKVDARYVTDVTKAFCETVAAAGYRAGYYTNQDTTNISCTRRNWAIMTCGWRIIAAATTARAKRRCGSTAALEMWPASTARWM